MPKRLRQQIVFKLANALRSPPDPKSRHLNPAYAYSLLIGAKNLLPKSSANGTVYRLCDIIKKLPQTIDCHGIQRPVTVVLKIYARVDQRSIKRQQEARRYAQLLKGKLSFSDI
jgi:hypothetical protein